MKRTFDAPDYLLMPLGGSSFRMTRLRDIAAQSRAPSVPPSRQLPDWRAARKYGFHNWAAAYCALSQGSNDGRAVWYCHVGEQFRDEQYADQMDSSIRHRGWWKDEHSYNGVVRGIVARLPHGRFLAGYEDSDNGERVYFDGVFSDELEAARAGDAEAERMAEREREYQARYDEARTLDDDIEMALVRIRECLALRNNECFGRLRAEAARLIERVRADRARLADEFAGVL